ncbi:glycine/D-amino acid oxidase-like deaminating enzyme [Rhizobium leguminosarum]|uniref:Glycine/D-amino acid oxidase-like deaminating enzyme n=1 Tax=Rhizobium leguminosarum TaxID=384 RepID=A0AAE2MKX8_RHILE|nr:MULTISPECIES: FAD-dependent oxidoreductase [Rhizobium]MBB4291045.1 glycine/D-amino acid oxidase-like deaminating enzyme [Rhizobium leguminosarum]MBB4297859.1 glycine/D-amino acid oxidase-like deaminating enzyme [Rhizobium leguminosarum]MBB4308998.1 glycine/D-amino acid oxidase-like deaminating enzyme [Rhizobium leguminosarum]MBB4416835.1 glycine/D-amino acid oxidase-like deaminating enzyme [Rhizobium leguminosarum]MBB4430196.1 glycine/D-amino acid oxidase-like deaminating enzyme [Rhizobium 
MEKADNPQPVSGQSSPELLIVGGGIMGLWAAVHAERRGIHTLIADAGRLGEGASGGLLGALMPHMPDRWSEKKQFQFDALVSLETEIAVLEAETGLSAGYNRSGRLIPLPKPHLNRIARGHSEDAERHWRAGERRFHWHVLDRPDADGWVEASAGESGFVHDTLAARVAPRSLMSALIAFLRGAKHVRIRENAVVTDLDPDRGTAEIGGETIAFGRCILAAGHQSFPLLQGLTPGLKQPLGQPVKGQAALLKADIDPALPTIFLDGLYVVAHEGGHAAIGSTSENRFDDPFSTDAQLDALIEAARAIVPSLRDAAVVERWAGLRPKAIDRDPMIGRYPDHPRLIALTGGFKVSFGLAHRLAEAAICIAGDADCGFLLPESFAISNHIAAASR